MFAKTQLGRRLPGAVAIGLLLFTPRVEAESPAESSKKSVQSFETIEPGGTLRIRNPYGSVHARFGGYESKIELLATIQRLDQQGAELELRTIRSGANLDILVVPAGEPPARERAVGRRDRLDLVLYVPEGIALDVETLEDLIELKGLHSDVAASTLRGDVQIRSIRGAVSAKSARGDVAITLESGVTSRPQRITTETGEIQLHLWEDADMQVDLATSGEISTDFSLEIEHRRLEEPGKRAVAVVGGGSSKLELTSKQGRIRLLRLPKPLVQDD